MALTSEMCSPLPREAYWYHADHIGSTALVTDARGEEYERLEYSPYGETWVEDTQDFLDNLSHMFSGKELDSETCLYYYGARYLDPCTSMWISADPAMAKYLPQAPVSDEAKEANGNLPDMGGVFNPVNLATYHYAGNNPVKYTDPDGREDYAKIEDNYRKLVTESRKKGWNVAADNLEYFLDGKGGIKSLSSSWLKGFASVQEAEKKNTQRYNAQFEEIASKMKDGDSIRINEKPAEGENAVGPFGKGSTDGWAAKMVGEGELWYASGKYTVTTFCDVTLTKKGGKVTATGTLLNIFWVPYDWHNGLGVTIPGVGYVPGSEAQKLVDAGLAKPFIMQSSWITSFSETC